MLHMSKLGMHYQVQLKSQKGFRQSYNLSTILFNIYLKKKLWTIGRRAAKEWECQSKKLSACFLVTILVIKL